MLVPEDAQSAVVPREMDWGYEGHGRLCNAPSLASRSSASCPLYPDRVLTRGGSRAAYVHQEPPQGSFDLIDPVLNVPCPLIRPPAQSKSLGVRWRLDPGTPPLATSSTYPTGAQRQLHPMGGGGLEWGRRHRRRRRSLAPQGEEAGGILAEENTSGLTL